MNLIEAHRDELETHGTLCVRRTQTGGRPATAYYLNEEQALLVCMFSKTENAAKVRKQVIDVFMAYRRGQLIKAVLGCAPQESTRPELEDYGELCTRRVKTGGRPGTSRK